MIRLIAYIMGAFSRVEVAMREFHSRSDILDFLGRIERMMDLFGQAAQDRPEGASAGPTLAREDLHLICFEFISSG